MRRERIEGERIVGERIEGERIAASPNNSSPLLLPQFFDPIQLKESEREHSERGIIIAKNGHIPSFSLYYNFLSLLFSVSRSIFQSFSSLFLSLSLSLSLFLLLLSLSRTEEFTMTRRSAGGAGNSVWSCCL